MNDKPESRRQFILKHMQELKAQDIHCQGCPGTCCTFRANSMQITPTETRDILNYLYSSKSNLELWKTRWQNCVQEFRLSVEVGNAKRPLRKTYTCPFFNGGPHGCQLPPEVKPYGCLAFNPLSKERNADNQGINCQALIETHAENELIEVFPSSRLKKLPIPLALLELAHIIAYEPQPIDSL